MGHVLQWVQGMTLIFSLPHSRREREKKLTRESQAGGGRKKQSGEIGWRGKRDKKYLGAEKTCAHAVDQVQ